MRFYSLTVLILCGFSLFYTPLMAAPSSYVIAEAGRDEFDNNDYYIASDLGGERGPHVQLEYGEGEQSDSTGTSVTESSLIGISSSPYRPVSIGVSHSNWSRDNAIDIDSNRFSLYINTDNWGITLSPEQRDISLTLSGTGMGVTGNSVVTFDSNGFGASVAYYGLGPVSISLYHVRYDYPARLPNLASRTFLASRYFSSAALDQAFSLEDRRTSVNLGYYLTDLLVGISLSRSIAAVDQSSSVTQVIYAQYDLDVSWFIGASGGRTSDDISNDATLFASASIGYQW